MQETERGIKGLNVQDSATFGRLEPYYANTSYHSTGLFIEEPDAKLSSAVKRNAKKAFISEGRLFRSTREELLSVPLTETRKPLLKMFHYEMGHLDFTALKKLIADRFW